MIKKIVKNKISMAIIIGSIIVTGGYIAKAANFEPGSNEDPIVTKSYVDLQISNTKEYIDNKIDNNTNSSAGNSSGNTIEIVSLNKEQEIILEGGSQVILRGGEGKIIDSEQGGIADLTQGVDLRKNYDAPANHLLLVPKSDGRGIKAITDCILMVTGKYEIK